MLLPRTMRPKTAFYIFLFNQNGIIQRLKDGQLSMRDLVLMREVIEEDMKRYIEKKATEEAGDN